MYNRLTTNRLIMLLDKIFTEIRHDLQKDEYIKRNEARLKAGKSKAKEWIPCNSCKNSDVLNAIKIFKPSTIDKCAYSCPLNPWYFITDKGYLYRLCQWDKLPTKEEKDNAINTNRWQLCCNGNAKQLKIYISKDKVKLAEELGYKVQFEENKEKGIKHWSLKISNELLKECCFNEDRKMLPFRDNRTNKHSCKRFSIIDEDGAQFDYESMKECYEMKFKNVCSWRTFLRGVNKDKTVLVIKNQSFIIIS